MENQANLIIFAENGKTVIYILLDIDGVLTSEAHTQKCVLEHRNENLYWMDWFDPACVEVLRELLDKTGADIIVSSSWREIGIDRLRYVWKHNDMPGELKSLTDEWIPDKKEALRGWIMRNMTLHPSDKYIILDDEPMGFDKWQVKTNPRTGLTKKDISKAINSLKGEKLKKGMRI